MNLENSVLVLAFNLGYRIGEGILKFLLKPVAVVLLLGKSTSVQYIEFYQSVNQKAAIMGPLPSLNAIS